jgi:hypothetical protein
VQLLIAMLLWVGFVVFLYLLAGWVIGMRHAIEAAAALTITFLVSLAATFGSMMIFLTLPYRLAFPAIVAAQVGSLILLYLIVDWIVTLSRKWAH